MTTQPTLYAAALDIGICATGWEPGVRLIGNNRAEDIARVAAYAKEALSAQDDVAEALGMVHEPSMGPKSPAEWGELVAGVEQACDERDGYREEYRRLTGELKMRDIENARLAESLEIKKSGLAARDKTIAELEEKLADTESERDVAAETVQTVRATLDEERLNYDEACGQRDSLREQLAEKDKTIAELEQALIKTGEEWGLCYVNEKWDSEMKSLREQLARAELVVDTVRQTYSRLSSAERSVYDDGAFVLAGVLLNTYDSPTQLASPDAASADTASPEVAGRTSVGVGGVNECDVCEDYGESPGCIYCPKRADHSPDVGEKIKALERRVKNQRKALNDLQQNHQSTLRLAYHIINKARFGETWKDMNPENGLSGVSELEPRFSVAVIDEYYRRCRAEPGTGMHDTLEVLTAIARERGEG